MGEGPIQFRFDCPSGDPTWTWERKPEGAADPQIVDMGDGLYSVDLPAAGDWLLEGQCCG